MIVREKKAIRSEASKRRGRIARFVRLGIAAVAVMILAVLPLQAQTESVLYSFGGPPADGGTPSGTLARDASGNLYGTTEMGGASNLGTVFKLHPNGDGTYTESLLYSFTNTGGDGETPETGVVMDGSGNLYGTTQNGGSTNCVTGCGIVFSLHPNGDGTYTESVLHGFTGHPDGASPGSLLIDASGNLYGTTLYGGSSTAETFCKTGCGAVFELANNSGTYTYSVLYSFTTNDFYGINPGGNLAIDPAGDLFGTATAGGGSTASCALGCGTVFELANDSGSYVPSLLYSFTGAPDAELPDSGLISDAQGNLYGVAGGGTSTACFASSACGAVFKLRPNGGGSYSESVVYSFTNSPDGANPEYLIIDTSGDIYGVTSAGGASTTGNGAGTVFELHSNADGSYSETVLYSFMGSPDGSGPAAGLVMDAFNDLYGTTVGGGTSTVCSISGCGTVFEIVPGAGGSTFAITATSGSNQTETVNDPFASQLGATVLDGNGHPPASAVTVTFTANASAAGASGTFANGTTTTAAPTNASGVATATVFTANGTAGSYTVTATAPSVTGTASFSLTNQAPAPAPTITSVTPNSGPAAGGETIVIAGQNFQPGATVVFGSTPATSVTVNSATSISVVVPALVAGTKVKVTNPDGQSATGRFTVLPSISSISPSSGRRGQTLNVAITGTGFVNGLTTADFGRYILVNSLMVTDGAHATANITIEPKAVKRRYPVRVILQDPDPLNPETFTASFDGFTVLPVVYSLRPDSGLQGQTFDVAIQGDFFQSGVTTANFGPNITVGAVTVTDGDDATVTITIAPEARVQRYHVSVITGTHTEDLVFGVLPAR